MAYIGSVTRSVHIQMGFNLHSHYSYNQIKLPEGCLREFRNITIESDYMCESLPDGPLERATHEIYSQPILNYLELIITENYIFVCIVG